ncbi:hypothetical protein U1U22_003714 [Proteus mirabilis]|uniref:Fimbrial-type adhesion domain-containing protein n=1 Tax=Providencia stuartii ATCC 25827 TaxID=471874 RepID=A0AA86YF70_PROST|nr:MULTISPECIES: hypothetical protein [Providencia]EDU57793.1 hypothetical protein PROSTU_04242 [Providencia stuartii ATCC 25827]ELZ9638963.1 hypothetical protein [Proteus mirabilis]MCR4082005.1 hypothetical protein [Providencia stuartii]MTC80909.1 hypothetical protein [Providencia stuartii]
MRYFHYILGIVMLALSAFAHSVTIDLTAEYNMNGSGKFINTTPISGYCAQYPTHCDVDEASVHLPLTTTISYPIVAYNEPRKGPYFNFPKTPRTLTVRNQDTGEAFDVIFRVTSYSSKFTTNYASYNWDEGDKDFSAPRGGGCSYYTTAWGAGSGTGSWIQFIWRTLNNTLPCQKISRIDRTEPSRFYDMSIGYSLTTKDSFASIPSGRYLGKLSFSVGQGGDFDFGDNYQADDSVVNINLTLSVNHDLIVTTTPEGRALSLQPCSVGKVCTEEQGKRNWERWMITKITPQLTARSDFLISSTGSFTAYLQCEYIQGEHCAIKSDNNGQLVPVKAYLSLPNNIINQKTNSTVTRALMPIHKDIVNNTFSTRDIGSNRKGSIDFLVTQHDVDTMLLTRPDTYRGTVTVIFDPNIY